MSTRTPLSNISNQTPTNHSPSSSSALYNLFSNNSNSSSSPAVTTSTSKNEEQQIAFNGSSPCFFNRSRVEKLDSEDDIGLGSSSKRFKSNIPREENELRTRKTKSRFGNDQSSHFTTFEKARLGFNTSPSQLSHRGFLKTLVSHNEADVYRCQSNSPYKNFSPPFAVAFSNAAKRGGKQVFGVASEEGVISFVNGSEDNAWDFDHGRTSFQAHRNAIFDLAWSKDDSVIATASGDQTSKLFDTTTGQCLGVLVGHSATLKSVIFDPTNSNLISTGARDGSIRIWDRRTSVEYETNSLGEATVGCVNLIKNAHALKGKNPKSRASITSVTSVLYLPHNNNLLASAGSSDGIVKFWDLRKLHSKRVNPSFVEDNIESATVGDQSNSRERGIISMVINEPGNKIFTLGTDSLIKSYDPLNLSYPIPLATFSHPELKTNSFYLKLVNSTRGDYLGCGGSDGGIYVWDSNGNGKDGIRLKGHEKEVGGLAWGYDTIASCSDDSIFRVWKMNERISRTRGEKEIGFRWSGEDE